MRSSATQFAITMLFLAFGASTFPSPAASHAAWTTSRVDGGASVFELDLETADASELFSLGSVEVGRLANESPRSLFFVDVSTNPTLHRVDVEAGLSAEIGPLGIAVGGEPIRGLTHGPMGRLWLCSDLTLFEIDTETGEAARVAPLTSALEALAHDDDRLLGLGHDDVGRSALFEVDRVTGNLVELYVLPPFDPTDLTSMDVGPDGALWIQAARTTPIAPPGVRHLIYRVDLVTGEVELRAELVSSSPADLRLGLVVLPTPPLDVPCLDHLGTLSLTVLLMILAAVRIRR